MIIFFDIETTEDEVVLENYETEQLWKLNIEKIPFMPELNKIITITVGAGSGENMKIKNLEGTEEEQIVAFFSAIAWNQICWFNIKGFDIPFIVKRALYYKLAIPNELKFFGRKSRELDHIIDLLDVYKCWVWGWTGNLDLACRFLWIKSPKDGISGSEVHKYYREWKIEKILEYCRNDVKATMELYNYFKSYNLI